MPFEHSAGAVMFYRGHEGPEFLLLRYVKSRGFRWDFPKGAIERDERLGVALRREVREETGILNIKIISGFNRRVSWTYKRADKVRHKTVDFLLVLSPTKKVRLSREHSEFAWLAYKRALERLKHKNAKEVLKKANEFLQRGAT